MEPDPNYPLSRCKAKKKTNTSDFFVDVNKISVNNIELAFGAKLDLDYDEIWSQ